MAKADYEKHYQSPNLGKETPAFAQCEKISAGNFTNDY